MRVNGDEGEWDRGVGIWDRDEGKWDRGEGIWDRDEGKCMG